MAQVYSLGREGEEAEEQRGVVLPWARRKMRTDDKGAALLSFQYTQ